MYCYICTSFNSIDLKSTVVDLDPKSQGAKNSSKSQPPFLCFSGFWMPSTYGIISRFWSGSAIGMLDVLPGTLKRSAYIVDSFTRFFTVKMDLNMVSKCNGKLILAQYIRFPKSPASSIEPIPSDYWITGDQAAPLRFLVFQVDIKQKKHLMDSYGGFPPVSAQSWIICVSSDIKWH